MLPYLNDFLLLHNFEFVEMRFLRMVPYSLSNIEKNFNFLLQGLVVVLDIVSPLLTITFFVLSLLGGQQNFFS